MILLLALACAPADTPKPGDECALHLWFADADGDGHGDPERPIEACEAPDGAVSDGEDCDDADPDAYPGAFETCDGDDDDCDGEVDEDGIDPYAWHPDADADGYGDPDVVFEGCSGPAGSLLDGHDCDDADVAVHPFATEVCDGVDQDCDGAIDEDAPNAPAWYADADGDGWGDANATTTACEVPPGFSPDPGDCDDADAGAFPGAAEVCDGVDDDCDGTVDEDDAADALRWYADADGDGFGDPSAATGACEAPAGYLADATDCDDADAATHPDADERCGGGDEDCDGVIDGDDVVDAGTWYLDGDADGHGDPSRSTSACDAPAFTVATADDCDDADPAVSPDGTETCDDVDQDCDGTADDAAVDMSTWYADTDGDGYGDPSATTVACDAPTGSTADASDCDDADPAVSPAAEEVCDGVDDDCDGSVDEDGAAPVSWYADADGDGYGDPSAATEGCSAPAGHVADATDCADADAAISPGEPEVCDGVDQDCDGVADDGVLPTWYADADGDGYGDPATAVADCAAPTGMIAVGDDCDDTSASVSPAATEDCATSADDDCDGATDADGALGCADSYADLDRDGSGSTSSVCRCLADAPFDAATDDDCDDGDASVSPTTAERLGDGLDNDCDGVTDTRDLTTDADAVLEGTVAGGYVGAALASAGDLDGDGYGDLAIGARGGTHGGTANGLVHVVYGPVSGSLSLMSDDVTLHGLAPGDAVGTAVDGGGDTDGDGDLELLIGAAGMSDGSARNGAALLVEWPVSADEAATAQGDTHTGEAADDAAGTSVAFVGDFDGDGLDDAVAGAPYHDDTAANTGAVYVLDGPVTGHASLAGADAIVYGDDYYDIFGRAVARAGDTNGDGLDDFLVGAPWRTVGASTNAGAAYLFTGPLSGSSVASSAATATFEGLDAIDYAGTSVAGAGDLDGDGYDDVAIGAPSAGGTGDEGRAYVFLGPVSRTRSVTAADSTLVGASSGDYFGSGVAGLGDFDGDGGDDLLVGAQYDDGGGVSSGAGWLFLAVPSGTIEASAVGSQLYAGEGEYAGFAVAAGGDLAGDGGAAALIGAYGWHEAGVYSGAVYVVSAP